MTYSEKLRDPRWQKRRLEIMQRDGWKCLRCGDSTKTLNVHHQEYIKGRDPWEYPESLLEILCEECHENHHNGIDRKQHLEALAESVVRNLHKAPEWQGDPPLVGEECLTELEDEFIAFGFGWNGFDQMMEIIRWISNYTPSDSVCPPYLQAFIGFATISPGIVDTYYAFFDCPAIVTYADLILLAPLFGIQILYCTDKNSLRRHLEQKRAAHYRLWEWEQPKSWAEAVDLAKQLSQPVSERWLGDEPGTWAEAVEQEKQLSKQSNT